MLLPVISTRAHDTREMSSGQASGPDAGSSLILRLHCVPVFASRRMETLIATSQKCRSLSRRHGLFRECLLGEEEVTNP